MPQRIYIAPSPVRIGPRPPDVGDTVTLDLLRKISKEGPKHIMGHKNAHLKSKWGTVAWNC